MPTRRGFLKMVPGLVVAVGGFLYAGYRFGGCPLSAAGLCVGPCSAFLDKNGDLLCDRLGVVLAQAPSIAVDEQVHTVASPTVPAAVSSEPLELLQEPTKAEVDAVQVPAKAPTSEPTAVPTVAPTDTPATQAKVACPFGLVNDKYPGRCKRYRDTNDSGYCDLSEVA